MPNAELHHQDVNLTVGMETVDYKSAPVKRCQMIISRCVQIDAAWLSTLSPMRLSSKLLFEIEGDAIIIQNGEHDAAQ